MRISFLADRSPNGLLSRTIKPVVLLVLISLGVIQILAQMIAPAPAPQDARVARTMADPETTGSIASAARNTVFNPCLIGIGRAESR